MIRGTGRESCFYLERLVAKLTFYKTSSKQMRRVATVIWSSRELTYPFPKALLKMRFLFPRWDMLVSGFRECIPAWFPSVFSIMITKLARFRRIRISVVFLIFGTCSDGKIILFYSPKTNMKPKNGGLEDLFPFPRGWKSQVLEPFNFGGGNCESQVVGSSPMVTKTPPSHPENPSQKMTWNPE